MTALGMRGTVAASADEAGEAQRPQVHEPQPPPKQRRRRISHKLEFKLKLVKLALARPRGHRIKPVCREFPEVEPVQLHKWIQALEGQARQSMGECDETTPPTPAVPIAQPVPCVPLGIAIRPYFYFHGMMPLLVLSPTPTLTGAATFAVHPFAAPIFAAPPGATPAIAADAVGAAASAAAALFPALPSPAAAPVEAVQGIIPPGHNDSEAVEQLLRMAGPPGA